MMWKFKETECALHDVTQLQYKGQLQCLPCILKCQQTTVTSVNTTIGSEQSDWSTSTSTFPNRLSQEFGLSTCIHMYTHFIKKVTTKVFCFSPPKFFLSLTYNVETFLWFFKINILLQHTGEGMLPPRKWPLTFPPSILSIFLSFPIEAFLLFTCRSGNTPLYWCLYC